MGKKKAIRITTTKQKTKIFEIAYKAVQESLREIHLNGNGAAHIIKNSHRFSEDVKYAVSEAMKNLTVCDHCKALSGGICKNTDEPHTATYPSEYRIKSVPEQVKILQKIFPKIGNTDSVINMIPLFGEAEGLFVIPKWNTIATTYAEALAKGFEKMRLFHNGRFLSYETRFDMIEISEQTQRALDELVKKRYGNFITVPIQFGEYHRRDTINCTLKKLAHGEFGIDPFSVCCMLITHPERLTQSKDLGIACIGGTLNDPKMGSVTPVYAFCEGKVEFGTIPSNEGYGGFFGAVTGFMF